MILTVYLSDGEQAVTEVPITPETTCRDVVEFCKEPGESGCHLAEVWRGNGKSWAKPELCGSERWRAATVHCTVTADPPRVPANCFHHRCADLSAFFAEGPLPCPKQHPRPGRGVLTHITHTHWAGAWYCGHLPPKCLCLWFHLFSFWMPSLKMSPFYKNEYLIVDRFMVMRLKTEHLDQALLVLTAQVVLFTLILMIFYTDWNASSKLLWLRL